MAIFLKGALVTFVPGSSKPSVITFQLNPETIRHSLSGPGGTPVETYCFTLLLDAALPHSGNLQTGFVQSQLNALEALLFSTDRQIAPPAVLFCWGGKRIPAGVTSLTITANSFDGQLNTLQAEVQITLIALTPAQVASLPAPMAAIAEAAHVQLAQSRLQALITAQTVTDPSQSSGGSVI